MKSIVVGAVKVLLAVFVSGCANPLNQATSNRYAKECLDAEINDKLGVAEQTCYRALVNACK